MRRILFVCMGNICRSPAAEEVMRTLVRQAGWEEEIEIDSAGTIGYHSGQPADRRMYEAAAQRGLQLTSRARQITPADLRQFDLIIAMDRDNYRDIQKLASGRADQVRLLSDYLDPSWPRDVPDPYYGGPDGFVEVLQMLEAACPQILAELQRGPSGAAASPESKR